MIAAGDSGQSNCTGIQAPGGEGTYYAQVIYAAQAALLSDHGLRRSRGAIHKDVAGFDCQGRYGAPCRGTDAG